MASRTADVAVVGGGVVGLSVALECAWEGFDVTVVYPRRHGPDSATLAAGAMVGAFGELDHGGLDDVDRQKLDLRVRAQDLHPEWLARLRAEASQEIHTTTGMFMIANRGGRNDVARLDDIKGHLDDYGRRNSWVAPGDVPGLEPHARFGTEKALFIDDDLTVDSAQLLQALLTSLRRSARCRIVHDRVLAVQPHGDGVHWALRTATNGRLEAPAVVVCAGARVPAVLGEVVLSTLRIPTLFFAKGIGVVVSGAADVPHAIRTPNRDDACGLHVVPRSRGRLYIGASNHYGYAASAARGVTPGEVSAILGQTIREINTTLRDATIESIRFGLRPLSSDDAPLIGKTRMPGLFLATGTFRTGIVMAPLIARLVVAEVAGRDAEVANPFSATDARRAKADYLHGVDLNGANLYADRGLALYDTRRTSGGAVRAGRALGMWRKYIDLAGDKADPRIVALMTRLEEERMDR